MSTVRRATLFLGVILILCTVAPPGAQAQEHCNALLSHGIRNEWVSVSQEEWDNLIFHRHCRSRGDSWSFGHDGQVGLQSPIPLGIAGSWFGSQQSRDEFCRKQADRSKGKEMEAARLSLLSADALHAWNQCQELAKRNVEIAIGDLDGRLLSFTIRRVGGVKVKLKAITHEGIAGCSIDGEAVESGQPLAREVNEGQVGIRCTRTEASPGRGMEVAYARAEIGIDTSEGSLDVNLPPIEMAFPETVEELRQETDLKLDRLERAFREQPNSPADRTSIVSHGGRWGSWKPQRMCPRGQYVCGYRSRFEDHIDGDDTALNAVELYCCPFLNGLSNGR